MIDLLLTVIKFYLRANRFVRRRRSDAQCFFIRWTVRARYALMNPAQREAYTNDIVAQAGLLLAALWATEDER